MKPEAYPAARAIAPVVHEYFARHHQEAHGRGDRDLAQLPSTDVVQSIIDAAFWASLRREEGFSPKISLAFLSPEDTVHPLVFERPLPLDASGLTRVSPAVERPGIHLGVWHDGEELKVWGTTRAIPALCFVLEVAAPGLLVIKHHSGQEAGKFINVAVIEGDLIKVMDEHASNLPDCPAVLTSLLGFESPASWAHSVNVLVQLALSMRTHGHGGLLLVVPADGEVWRESIVWPMHYAVSPRYSQLKELSRETPGDDAKRGWQEALGRTVDAVAGLTAVDGAVVLTNQYDLLGFGAKIGRRRGHPQVEQITLTEPIEGGEAVLVHPEQLGGTRHLSAAQFVQDQHECIALVASQDGRFTIFEWSPCANMVHAHRIESLLL